MARLLSSISKISTSQKVQRSECSMNVADQTQDECIKGCTERRSMQLDWQEVKTAEDHEMAAALCRYCRVHST